VLQRLRSRFTWGIIAIVIAIALNALMVFLFTPTWERITQPVLLGVILGRLYLWYILRQKQDEPIKQQTWKISHHARFMLLCYMHWIRRRHTGAFYSLERNLPFTDVFRELDGYTFDGKMQRMIRDMDEHENDVFLFRLHKALTGSETTDIAGCSFDGHKDLAERIWENK
jgi:hypothetical protein